MRFLYKIIHIESGKIYIGQTKNFVRRMSDHKYNTTNKPLYNAIQKYGWDSFEKEIIAECSDDIIDNMEIETIKHFNSLNPNGYNLETGGNCLKEMCKESRLKMSSWQTGRRLTLEHKNNISKSNKGKHSRTFTKEHKENISKAMKDKKRCGHSNNTKNKMSESAKKRWNREKTNIRTFNLNFN